MVDFGLRLHGVLCPRKFLMHALYMLIVLDFCVSGVGLVLFFAFMQCLYGVISMNQLVSSGKLHSSLHLSASSLRH